MGFDFFQVLPEFINKAKDYITKSKEKNNPFFLYLPLAAPHTPWVPKANYNGISQAGQYGEFVTMVDDHIGDLLEHLKNSGLEEDTIVVFASDNGPYWKQPYIDEFDHRAAGELRGMKGDIYDGGHRIPHIVKWPGKINAGSKNHIPNTRLVIKTLNNHTPNTRLLIKTFENHIPNTRYQNIVTYST